MKPHGFVHQILYTIKTKNKMKKQERINRVIARGEGSNHSHVIVGDAQVTRNSNGEILIEAGKEEFALKHILESNWLNGQEVFTKEHGSIFIDFKKNKSRKEIIKNGEITGMEEVDFIVNEIRQGDVYLEKISERTYKYIAQQEYDPYNDLIQQVRD